MRPSIIAIIVVAAIILAYFFVIKPNQSMNKQMNLSPAEFGEKIEQEPGVVIDVRTRDEYASGHLAIADHQYNLLDGEFEKQLDSLDKDATYYLYCRSGNRSGQAARLMKERGFENVYNIGGFQKLASEGFETR
jgi:phage shock protein E